MGVKLLLRWTDRAAFLVLLLAIFLAPLPLGSNRPWAMAGLAIWIWTGLLLAMVSRLGKSAWPSGLHRGRWPLASAALFCALIAGQLAWARLVPLQPDHMSATLSVWHTQLYLIRSLTCFGAMLLAVLTLTRRSRCIQLLGVVLATGLFQVGLAIVLSRSGVAYEYLFVAFEPNARLSGTFANANHFAGHVAMALAAGIGLLIAQYEGQQDSGGDWRSRITAFLQFALSLKMILRLALVILVIGLVLSHSRMGNVAFFLALVISGLVLAVRSRKMRKAALVLVSTMLVIDLLIVGQWIGLDRIAERFSETPVLARSASGDTAAVFAQDSASIPREESVEERLQVPLLAAKLALARPWFGHGGGTFHLAFAPVKPDWVYSGQWNYAHNDFAEVAVDMGLIGLALWLAIGVFSTFKGVRLVSDRQPRLNRGVGIATLIALISTGLQSLMDFGLQIPANALNFSVLLTMSWLVGGLPLDIRAAPPLEKYTT